MSPIAQTLFDNGKADVVIEMLKDNQPIELIAKFTKFTIEKIKEIAENNNLKV